jgi:hypothetical protein
MSAWARLPNKRYQPVVNIMNIFDIGDHVAPMLLKCYGFSLPYCYRNETNLESGSQDPIKCKIGYLRIMLSLKRTS